MKKKLLICLLTFSLVLVWSVVIADDFYVIPVKKRNYAPVAKTGQTTSYATGDDGELEKGVPWPDPRFTDNGNGTATDKLTGLIWLNQGTCSRFFFLDLTQHNYRVWEEALKACNLLSTDYCGLSDGSQEGDWRLPNRNELNSLIDLGQDNPAKPDGCPITQAVIHPYWSATSFSNNDLSAWGIEFTFGKIDNDGKDEEHWVLCVRGGQ